MPNKVDTHTYGIYSELMDAKYDPEIQYLRRLASAKKTANQYFLHGRVMRQLPTQNHLPKETVVSFPWLSRDGSSLLVPITAVKRGGPKQDKCHFNVEIDLYKYGFDQTSAMGSFTVNKIPAYEGQ